MAGKEKWDHRIRSCYISAPIGTNIENIRSSLLERKVKLLSPSSIDVGRSVHSNVLDLISKADLVVGVLTRERRSDTVIFELGQTVALGHQVVVFAPPKSGYIPFDLRQFPVLRTSLRNRSAIDFAFDQILSAPPLPKKKEMVEVHGSHGMGKRINTFLDKVRQAIDAHDGLGFEKVVTQAIRESGVEIIVEAPSDDREVDLAVWSDEFIRMFGHPLIIEMKVNIRSEAHALQSLKECAEMSAKLGSTWCLLLYGDGPQLIKKSWISNTPTVLSISAYELMKEMRVKSFVDIIRDLRNQRVHFGGV